MCLQRTVEKVNGCRCGNKGIRNSCGREQTVSLRPGSHGRILNLSQEFQTAQGNKKKINNGYSCFCPTVCDMRPHGNDETPHMNRFYSQTSQYQAGNLPEPCDRKCD